MKVSFVALALVALCAVTQARDLRDEESAQVQDLEAAGGGHHEEWKKGGGEEHHADHHSSHGSKGDKG